jgi:hypothetical protein
MALIAAFNVFMAGWVLGGEWGEGPSRLRRERDDFECLAWRATYLDAECKGTLNFVVMESLRPPACPHVAVTTTTTTLIQP